ncbi:MAG: molybdenum cofactor guanylyltransferase [Cyanobacteriota bacterium]|nr:molybdenum cofactor guanylyltransferase [Cyanobacteriota bacterium]
MSNIDNGKKNLVALILAGGKSSRMGRDKALIDWQGTPMLKRVYQVAADCTEKVHIITPWPERYRDILPADCQWLIESTPGQGPMVGFARALPQISSSWVLLLGCDLPELNSDIIKSWISQLEEVSPDILAVVPKKSQSWEPLCGFYRQEVLSELDKYCKEGDREALRMQHRSFQNWLPTIPVRPLSVGEKEAKMLRNYNTPSDLDK